MTLSLKISHEFLGQGECACAHTWGWGADDLREP